MQPLLNRPFLERIVRPNFCTSLKSLGKWMGAALSLPVLSFVVSFGLQILAWQRPTLKLPNPSLLSYVFGLIAFILIILWKFYLDFRNYAASLNLLHERLRQLLLTSARIDYTRCTKATFSSTAIRDVQGTVHLVIDKQETPGLVRGSRLDVVASALDQVWGTVEVVDEFDHSWSAIVVDRDNVDFWENLEDRMKYDPTPPPGVHLEPAVRGDLRRILSDIRESRGEK